MLVDVMSGKEIHKIPYEQQFRAIEAKLAPTAFAAMVRRINELIDESGAEIATAGWLPGHDWTGTVFQPIFDAANCNRGVSARFFGQLVWYTVMHRSEAWASGRYEKDGAPIPSRTYFRVQKT